MNSTIITRLAQDSVTPYVRTCRCGQQLDVCARAHCPRCGCTLHDPSSTDGSAAGTLLDRLYVA